MRDEFEKKLKALSLLEKKRDEQIEYLKELVRIYEIDSKLFTPEIWFDLINHPKDFISNDSKLGIMELRASFRDKHFSEAEKIQDLNQEIYVHHIDVILDKIKLFEKELDPEEDLD